MFSRKIQYEKPQGTSYRGLQAIVTDILQNIRSFFLAPLRLMVTVSQEKSLFHKKNTFGQFFPYYR